MKHTLIPIFIFIASYSVSAKGEGNLTDTAGLFAYSAPAKYALSTWKPEAVTAPTMGYYGRGGGVSVHFLYGLALGYAGSTLSSPGNTLKGGGGFLFDIDLGIGIEFPSRNQDKSGLLSITGYYALFGTSITSKDAQGNTQKDKRQITAVGAPISYTHIRGGEGTGLYWEVGANLTTITDADNEGTSYTKQYSSFYVAPFISGGLAVPFEIVKRGSHAKVGEGKALVGPFVSYSATNMMQLTGVTMHGYSIGICYQYVFL